MPATLILMGAGVLSNSDVVSEEYDNDISFNQADAMIPEINDITEASNSELTADPTEALVTAATLQGFGDDFKLEDASGKFYEAAVTYDNDSYFMISEWTALDY